MIAKLVREGKLRKLNRKYYENASYQGTKSDFYYVPVYAPKGTICLLSAAVYWQLSTARPTGIDVAVPRDSKIYTRPAWPRFELFFFDGPRYELGTQVIDEEGHLFRIYDAEKTVVDILSYKDLIGVEQVKEVVTRYLGGAARDLNKLYGYASHLNARDALRTYLDVLL
ncbi:MAG: hypothetical protein AB9880_11940 [Christensenellales bacterium]